MSDPGAAPGWPPTAPASRRITLALFLAGAATFAMAYAPQPLLPVLRTEFGVTPASATLSLSITTGAMGLALLVFGPVSDAVGRVRVELGLDALAARPPSGRTALTPDERRLLAEVPPHHVPH